MQIPIFQTYALYHLSISTSGVSGTLSTIIKSHFKTENLLFYSQEYSLISKKKNQEIIEEVLKQTCMFVKQCEKPNLPVED